MTKITANNSSHIQRYYWIMFSTSTSCILSAFLIAWILKKKLLCSRFNRDSENEANGIEMRDVGNRADEETEINPQR